MKSSTDWAAKNYFSAIETYKKAFEMEKKDPAKAAQLYQEAATKFHYVTCQPNAKPDQIQLSLKMKGECAQKANYLLQALAQNSPPTETVQNATQGQKPTHRPPSKTISTTIAPPPPTNVPQRRLTANDKTQSSSHISSPVKNIYQTQIPNQIPPNPQQNIYQTTRQEVPIPQVEIPNNVPIPQVEIPHNIPAPQATSQISNPFQEAFNNLTNGLLMDNDGFYDKAKYFYSKSISSFNALLATNSNSNQNNVQFWMYQLQQRLNKLDFYHSLSPDASSFYFNKSFYIFNEIKKLQTAENIDAEVIQRKMEQYLSKCISMLKKCIITNDDPFISNLAQNYLNEQMASNLENENETNFHSNYIQEFYPDNIAAFAPDKVKNELSSAISSKKKFVLVYGPSGTKISKLIHSTSAKASVKMVYSVNFLKFIGTNENPVDILKIAFDNAKKETPSYLILNNIDACFPSDTSVPDNLSTMISDFLISQIPSIPDGVTVFCTSYMPWKIYVPVFDKFDAKIYIPAPDVPTIKEILKNNTITQRANDSQSTLMANELVGYTEITIERILIHTQLSCAIQSSGGRRNSILTDISEGFILRNEITSQDIAQIKSYIQPVVSADGLTFFDQFSEIK